MKKGNKKNKEKLYTNKSTMNDETKKIIRITVAVVLVVGIVYLVTALVNGEIKLDKEKDTTEAVEIQYEEIIAGQTFNRNESEYYVLLYNFTGNRATLFTALKDKYVALDKLKMYIVDLDKGFNTPYIASKDESITEYPSSIDDFKVKEATLVKISSGKVVERITSEDSIYTKLKELIG